MPYIQGDRRREFNITGEIKSEGELAYVIYLAIIAYLRGRRASFAELSGVIGVLESVKAEFYRRVLSKYEDRAIKRNGDVVIDLEGLNE